jgi:hypothetical protein
VEVLELKFTGKFRFKKARSVCFVPGKYFLPKKNLGGVARGAVFY